MGKIIILGGPSGSGKTTIMKELVEQGLANQLITVTTRRPRNGEKDGVDYYFSNPVQFDIDQLMGEIPEVTEYAGVKYGIYRRSLEDVKDSEQDVVVVLDRNGLEFCRTYLGKDRVIGIYIGISTESMRERMVKRGNSPMEILRRIEQAKAYELTAEYQQCWDAVVWNTDGKLDYTMQKVKAILKA